MIRCHIKRFITGLALTTVFGVMAIATLRRYRSVHQYDSPTVQYWGLVGRAHPTNGIMTKSRQPHLWRPDRDHLARDDDRVLAQLVWGMEASSKSTNTPIKTIYIPDSFHWWSKPWRGTHILGKEDCPGTFVGQCTFSESEDSMDAVIAVRDSFHQLDITVPSNVLKFYFILESPFNSNTVFQRSNDLMATFYRGSDINTPYGKWVYYDPYTKFKHQGKDYALGKTKMAAAFISNCGGRNNRNGYITELQKYISVDVYGGCGTLVCDRNDDKKCFEMLKKDYRFYLSFENSNCRDYITEKLFMNAFENDVIPIVMGAHPEDYEAVCPENSYIHVENFSSPEELAKYMHHLAETPSDFNSYFRWKGTGEFIDTHFFCRVCAMVHYADVVPPPTRLSDHVWNSEAAVKSNFCLPGGAWYWDKKPIKPKSSTTIVDISPEERKLQGVRRAFER